MRADAARLNIQTGRHPQTREPAAMPSKNIVHIAIELSVSSWLVAARLPGADKSRLHRITGGDTTALLALIAELRARASAKLGQAVEVACCFEAGRDGVWLHRLLTAHGIAAYVLEPASILVNRRARRAKTDRLDAEGMLRVLAAWSWPNAISSGESGFISVEYEGYSRSRKISWAQLEVTLICGR